jgi:hypothetical protein
MIQLIGYRIIHIKINTHYLISLIKEQALKICVESLTHPHFLTDNKNDPTVLVAKAKARRFVTGVSQLSLSEFSSLNAAGRTIGLCRPTGENRIRRLVDE